MKNAQIFSCLLFTAAATHCMEFDNHPTPQKQEPTNPWNAINYLEIEQSLNADYRNYCTNRLIEYKKTTFTPQHMQHIEQMAITYTGNNNLKKILYNVRDEEDNHFPHIAVQKFDLPTLTWLVTQKLIYYPKNKQNKGFMEACIDHLSPHNNINTEKKQIAYDMLNVIITNYGNRLALSLRKPIVEKLITLQIEHKKQHNNDILAHIVFTPLLAQDENNNVAIIDLPTLYQQVTDADGNTFSHIVVNKNDVQTLYQLIKDNRVSPTPNKAKKTVVDLALANFQCYIKSHYMNDSSSHKEQELDETLDALANFPQKDSLLLVYAPQLC